MDCIGANGRAEIKYDAFAFECRPDARNCRALDAGHHLELELGHGHKRAGVASGHCSVCLSFLDGIKGKPHGRFPAPLAQGLARFVVCLDRYVRVHDT